MKTMKKLVAALLVLTMVLALTGSAFAACKWEKYQIVKFTKNTVAYKTKGGKATSTIVRKGSYAVLAEDQSGKWVKLWLNQGDASKTGWFKTDNLVDGKKGYPVKLDGKVIDYKEIHVVYSQGGVGGSSVALLADGTEDIWNDVWTDSCKKHVKATSSVWMHKKPCLKYSYGKALRKNQKAEYRRVVGWDDRGIMFYGIKFDKKKLWVSSEYSKLVK